MPFRNEHSACTKHHMQHVGSRWARPLCLTHAAVGPVPLSSRYSRAKMGRRTDGERCGWLHSIAQHSTAPPLSALRRKWPHLVHLLLVSLTPVSSTGTPVLEQQYNNKTAVPCHFMLCRNMPLSFPSKRIRCTDRWSRISHGCSCPQSPPTPHPEAPGAPQARPK